MLPRFDIIWDQHKDHLSSFIKTKVKDPETALDILQDVGLKLTDTLNRGVVIKNERTWLFQVTRNTISDFYRKKAKEINSISFPRSSHDDPCVCDLSGFVIRTYLPEKYATALYMSDIEKVAQQDIAEKLDLSLTATKSRIQRARKKLKELVTDCIDISFNQKGEITDFQLKTSCTLPPELIQEMERINLIP